MKREGIKSTHYCLAPMYQRIPLPYSPSHCLSLRSHLTAERIPPEPKPAFSKHTFLGTVPLNIGAIINNGILPLVDDRLPAFYTLNLVCSVGCTADIWLLFSYLYS